MTDVVAPNAVNYGDQLPLGIEARSNRRLFFPSTGDSYASNGTNIIRITINADSMLDTSQSYLKFDLKNTSRITITARNTSWIQLRDIRTNRMILSKVLKKDQSYQIPDRPGLSLMTGNAGALEITVDGEVVPEVGKLGEIRRKILMEVKRLKSGQAVVE